ncbi:MAG: DUF423 domain-containing protein [Pseudomonadota bacterium]
MNSTAPRNNYILIAACSGFLVVALGAFGAHALEGQLDARAREVFDTAVQYQMMHTLALLAVGVLLRNRVHASRTLSGAGIAFTVGLVLFSGSLYLLSITGVRWLGAITPLGGVGFLIGWVLLFSWALVGDQGE